MSKALVAAATARPIAMLSSLCGLLASFATLLFGLTAISGIVVDAASAEAQSANSARVLTIEGAIGPGTSDYVVRGLAEAASDQAAVVILELDTPGGLDTSMREIVRAILASPVPVVGYVTPRGARAASAGTYILYATHVAAMAPATNLGAATPVAIGGAPAREPARDDGDNESSSSDETDALPADASARKAVNDAVAYIRGLAEERGRNADWAERAVRRGESASAEAALALGVIEIIAANHADLLEQVDGRAVVVDDTPQSLATSGLELDRREPDWRTRFLAVVGNPTVAYLLMLIGIYGLALEGYSPGALVPGTVGAISLLLALFAFQILPVNYAGLALVVLGIGLMASELFMPSFGVLGIGGIVAFAFGSVILVDSDVPGFEVSRPLIGAISVAAGAGLLGILFLVARSRQTPVVSGVEQMIGSPAVAIEAFDREGVVLYAGEYWNARSPTPVSRGEHLVITGVSDLVLDVQPREYRK
jgi:membrane-bound serine protease (ClpP class)